MLLKETPDIESKRKELDAKVSGLEGAIRVLGACNGTNMPNALKQTLLTAVT